MKYGLFSFLTVLLVSSFGFAQTLLVSDVDDTIKLANVQSYAGSARYAVDSKSRFMGMSELYQLLLLDNPDLQIVYLTKAPSWLMQKTHLSFLKNGKFPEGRYIPRKDLTGSNHKIETLRALLPEIRPKKVILIGDNGEKDATIYRQIVSEFASTGIEFHQFIRTITYTTFFNPFSFIARTQVAFVTPIEVSLELEKNGFLKKASVQKLLDEVGPDLANEKLKQKNDAYAFPSYVSCQGFDWHWNDRLADYSGLEAIKTRIENRCGLVL